MRRASWQFARLALVAALSVPSVYAQQSGVFLHPKEATRIADPKLEGGGCRIVYQLDAGPMPYTVTITARENGKSIGTIFSGPETGGWAPKLHFWNGKDANGRFVDPGHYSIRVEARSTFANVINYPVDVIRLGLTNIAAESSAGTNEWQIVYFLKKGAYKFYATPSTSEWASTADVGDVSELDLNDGTPRLAPAVHAQTDEAELRQSAAGKWDYDTTYHDYPVCYLSGAQPQFTVTFGATGTDASGASIGCNYPVAGYDLRCVARDEAGVWTSTNNVNFAPGATATFVGPALTTDATRTDRHVAWHWQYRATGSTHWNPVPGAFTTEHWLYTIINTPFWSSGATGIQYSGPWAEVLDYMYTWQQQFGITPSDDSHVVELLIKGFNGKPTLDHAIEGVEYDCPINGGDGGATHYFDFGHGAMDLSHLLNNHAYGMYVNCSDCAGGTSSMLGMLGIQNVQMELLSSMTLRAIWGIGSPDYTLDLWSNGGGAGDSFSYHHIITRNGGTDISDACLWVDDDGHPNKLPGTPGFNTDRDWSNYESLLARANVTWTLDVTPKLK